MSKIDETLKKIAAATPNGEVDPSVEFADVYPGDPDCPNCHGLGYLRQDLPIGHPDFGKVVICNCRQGVVRRAIHDRLFAMSNLERLSHLTFDNFQPRGRIGISPWQASSLELAFNQAQQFARHLNGWLLLQGRYGCGKTHLAAAVGNFAVGMGVPTLFITVPDLLDSLRFAYSDPDATFEQRFDDVRRAPLLIMDDFGTQNATPWAQEKLFQIINYRYINALSLVVTTNLMLDEIEGRIRSRLQDPNLVTRVHIQADDYRHPTVDSSHSELSTLSLHHDQTFATFELRKGENLPKVDLQSLEKALQVAVDYAKEPYGWLVFTGPYGSGKTHLAAAIANACADLGRPPMFINVPDLLDHLRATFSPTSATTLDHRFEEIRSTPLLVLDDLGAQAMTRWAQEKLYQLFNFRYQAKLPTVITTADYKHEMDPRLLSRMEDVRLCSIVPITVPAYRGGGTTTKSTGRHKRDS